MQEENHIFQGLKRDNHQIRQEPQFLWNAHNIRLTNRENNTLFSITNEKGTKNTKVSVKGSYVGHCVLGKYLVLFTTTKDKDYIHRIEKKEGSYDVKNLYGEWMPHTKLNFSVEHPIEAFGDYESELVQKVYWTDGINQPRVINITDLELHNNQIGIFANYTNTTFDFVREINFTESITIEKRYGDGIFSPGTIQYAFTYYKKYGQESNIFYTSPIYYISHKDRGGNGEEKVLNNFAISIENGDYKFDYVRVYSIHRTSIDSVPTVKRVGDIEVKATTKNSIVDTGTIGENVDPQKLLYIGGEEILAGTMCAKDGTLFLGNIEIKREEIIPSSVKNELKALEATPYFKDHTSSISKNDYYSYDVDLNTYDAGFKAGEWYRLGIQFQYKTGKWSTPLPLKDVQMPLSYRPSENKTPIFKFEIPESIINSAFDKGYKRVRGVMVQPTTYDRTIVAQGMLCPTVFNINNRINNTPFSQASWFVRPFHLNSSYSINNNNNVDKGAVVQFEHLNSLFNNLNRGGELQTNYSSPSYYEWNNRIKEDEDDDFYNNIFVVDQSIVTFHSPDIEWSDSIKDALNNRELKLRIVGTINFTSNIGDIDIQTSTPTVGNGVKGFTHKMLGNTDDGGTGLISGLFYNDSLVLKHSDKDKGDVYDSGGSYRFMIYPFQHSGSLNNDQKRPEDKGTRSAVLSKKIISNLKFSAYNKWLTEKNYWEPDGIKSQIFNSEEVSLIKLDAPDVYKQSKLNYYGNVDSLITSNYGRTVYGLSYESNPMNLVTGQTVNGKEGEAVIGSNDPIRMKYKSTPHAVFVLTKNHNSIALPRFSEIETGFSESPFWEDKSSEFYLEDIIKVTYHTNSLEPDNPGEGQIWVKEDEDNLLRAYEYKNGFNGWGWYKQDDPALKGKYYRAETTNTSQAGWWQADVDNMPNNAIQLNPIEAPSDLYVTIGNITLSREEEEEQKPDHSYLFLAELYKDKPDNIFGGNTDEAIQNNLWVPAGLPINIETNKSATIDFEFGDTWYSRYDCLKTYPFTSEDENQIVEIASFMCETRVNANGRWDKNRGQNSNLHMTPQNFNRLNDVYTQKDNFFNYRILDDDYYKQNVFGNQVTWSLEKMPASDIDLWTNITLANTLSLSGDKGKITSIKAWNENLVCFQEKAINQILFNNRVQIPVTDGVPIEISNSYKVDGSRIISDSIGCSNKWSILATSMGIYFIDFNSDSIYLFNGQLSNLGKEKYMDWWTKQNNTNSTWIPFAKPLSLEEPIQINGIRSFYDFKYGDVYFTPGPVAVNQSDALCFSEHIGQFTSFLSYGGVLAMFNFGDGFYSLKNGEDEVILYENNAGDYNDFYGEIKGWDFSFISNQNPTITKVFDTVELRADHFYIHGVEQSEQLENTCPINFIKVDNEYQKTGEVDINSTNMRKKFRVWRGFIPRCSQVNSNSGFHLTQDSSYKERKKYGRARIRNPWSMITLGWKPKVNTSNNKVIIHDVSVKYTI